MKSLLLLSVACTLVAFTFSATAEQKLKNCNDVRAAYSSKGFNINDVPNKGVNGAPLKVCPQGYSCCTVEMEEKLSQQSHSEIKAPVSQLSTNLQSTFRQRHSHFDSDSPILKCNWSYVIGFFCIINIGQHIVRNSSFLSELYHSFILCFLKN
uniref:Glypican-1 n=1 Tax=Periophthalmus magnuspinnatus TaxID=409849 RepID=A0A3B4ADY9_9GOBI